jgi:2-keto-4-pentenoate hydratase/2-oxohepta-3-ene-1,7-dioic acid hydratase in catechol pathway
VGVVQDDHVYELGADVGSISEALARGFGWMKGRAREAAEGIGVPLSEISFLPPIPDPAKIICVGLNYADHQAEAGREGAANPPIFFRWADTQIGHEQPAVKPASSEMFDYEGEVAVVIGKAGRGVSVDAATEMVAGYSCYNDFSARDWQNHTSQWGPGKNFPGTGGFGPWLVTVDEVPDPAAMRLITRVNGEQRQSASVGALIFSIPRLVSYITRFTPLSVGDVIVTGTPAGVGLFREPPCFLVPGDRVEVEVTGVGTLRNTVVAEAGPDHRDQSE